MIKVDFGDKLLKTYCQAGTMGIVETNPPSKMIKVINAIKRDGSIQEFDPEKITNAVLKALKSTAAGGLEEAQRVTKKVQEKIEQMSLSTDELPLNGSEKTTEPTENESTQKDGDLSVEQIQDLVEQALMELDYYDTAKAYILYREERKKLRERNLFRKRTNLKPYEYPELAEYVDAIRHSYWIHTEFNYTSDINDFKTNVNEKERTAIKNAMLAIAQIEVAVKTFWGDIYKKMPKPEIGAVGFTFAESEVRHMNAYSHLLEILGLNDEFESLLEVPAIKDRVRYLEKVITLSRSDDNETYMRSVALFSLFIEHVSLFSQFLIIMAFNKHKNLFKGISNAVEATSKEEQIHGLFGIELINIIKQENPGWFGEDYEEMIQQMCREAYEAEEKIVDWIFEAGEIDILPKAVVLEFIKNRLNNSLVSIGAAAIFEVDEALVEQSDWFDMEVIATKHVDFFYKRSINYNKRAKSVTKEDLF